MKFITEESDLNTEFKRLTSKYSKYYWSVAWASSGSSHFKYLKENKFKIKKIIVGLHFYQTHPDFIETFLKSDKIKYIKQTSGTFHPKVYLFSNEDGAWEALVGSANFTNAAFTQNREATVLISSQDNTSSDFLDNIYELIDKSWSEAQGFSSDELKKYRTSWLNQQRKIKSLSNEYGETNSKNVKLIYDVPVTSMTWKEFFERVESESSHGIKKRLKVVELAHKLFSSNNHFNELTTEERKFIAGIPNKLNIDGAEDWGFFGSMKGAGIFKNRIIENDENISKALDQIPLTGIVTKANYNDYLNYYTQVFTGKYVATATRLLAMKRPDIFYCLTSRNQKNLCRDFGLKYSDINYSGYWEHIIERIFDSEWWINPTVNSNIELRVSKSRAAFLDSIYYE